MNVISIATKRPAQPATLPPAERTALIDSHLSLVRPAARRLIAGLPACFELDDLVSEGVLGLMKAAASYNPALGVPFPAWALVKIRGEMLQYVRDEARRHTEELFELTAEQALQTEPFAETDAELSREGVMQHVRHAWDALPPRERKVLYWYYVRQQDMRAIGEQLGISKGRVCHLHKRALALLRRELERRGQFAQAA